MNGKENLSLSECRHPDRRAEYLDALRGASRRQRITEVLAPLAALGLPLRDLDVTTRSRRKAAPAAAGAPAALEPTAPAGEGAAE